MKTYPMETKTRIASLSFDLDDKWAYLKTNGDPAWKSYPSYLELLVPREQADEMQDQRDVRGGRRSQQRGLGRGAHTFKDTR